MHSTTRSAPRPSVSRRTAAATSSLLAERHVGAESARDREPRGSATGDDRARDSRRPQRDQPQQRDRARADHERGRVVAHHRSGDAGDAEAHRRQRLEQRGLLEGQLGGLFEHVDAEHALGNADVLGVSAEDHRVHEGFAEVLLVALAEEAAAAGAGVGRHHGLADAKALDLAAGGDDLAGEFVTERRGARHLRMAAPKRLEIGAAGERGAHAHDDVARARRRIGSLDDHEPARLLENAALHLNERQRPVMVGRSYSALFRRAKP